MMPTVLTSQFPVFVCACMGTLQSGIETTPTEPDKYHYDMQPLTTIHKPPKSPIPCQINPPKTNPPSDSQPIRTSMSIFMLEKPIGPILILYANLYMIQTPPLSRNQAPH